MTWNLWKQLKTLNSAVNMVFFFQFIFFHILLGVKFVRTGEVFEIRDEDGVVLNDLSKPDERSSRIGVRRKIKLNLDSIQYYHDMKVIPHPFLPKSAYLLIQNGVECYESLNLVVRRHPRENNFKSVLNALSNLQQSPNLERYDEIIFSI